MLLAKNTYFNNYNMLLIIIAMIQIISSVCATYEMIYQQKKCQVNATDSKKSFFTVLAYRVQKNKIVNN